MLNGENGAEPMDTILPAGFTGVSEAHRRNTLRRESRLRVRTDAQDHAVMELTANGFVIEADGRPPLRGYADIFRGDNRVLHGLVQCSWAEDGLVGYEFKRDTAGAEVSPDHVPPVHAGLLNAPDTR